MCLRQCLRDEGSRIAREFESRHGPTVVILNELEDRYLPVPFDHGGHSRMAEMAGGCALCHHYTPEGLKHPACKTCHEIGPGKGDIRKPGLKGAYHRQCLSCHREWSGENQCSVCHHARSQSASKELTPTPGDLIGRMHPPIPEPKDVAYTTQREEFPATRVLFRHTAHIQDYDLRCAECHREDGCVRCHSKNGSQVRHVRTLDEHHKPCMSCHEVRAENACARCHYGPQQSPPPPFNHASTGWPLSAHHARLSCRACHEALPYTQPDHSCNRCHGGWESANFNHAVTGQMLNETHKEFDCADCHAERRFDLPPTCSECHEPEEGITFPARRPGPRETSPAIPPAGAPDISPVDDDGQPPPASVAPTAPPEKEPGRTTPPSTTQQPGAAPPR
jgi:hypothetical protein